MFNDKNIAYKEIIDKADGGNPAAMFELAMLYDSNAIPSHYDDDYIYWLKKFLLSEQIQSIIDDLDDEEGTSSGNCFDFIGILIFNNCINNIIFFILIFNKFFFIII